MDSTRRWRRLYSVLLLTLTVTVVTACGGSGGSGGDSGGQSGLPGTYQLLRDSTGTTPRAGASVTLTLNADGTLSLKAVQPGEELTDQGTYKVDGDRMTIEFRDQELSAKDAPYKYDGQTLEIPILMFSDGQGSSIWQRSGGQAAASGTQAPPRANWNAWDLDKDVAAAATKAYYEAVQKGTPQAQAVQQAADLARRNSNVAEVTLSANNLNVIIRYKDGSQEYVVTERLVTTVAGRAQLQEMGSPVFAAARGPDGSAPIDMAPASTIPACVALPGAPAAGSRPEPGREGVHPAGGYGVTAYLPDVQPKPVRSSDSPPANARRALLISPAYDLPHSMPSGKYESIRTLVGDGIECVAADLGRAGYSVDTILGRADSAGKSLLPGDKALEEMTRLLTSQPYGVLYYLSHGAQITSSLPWVDNFTMIYMGVVDLERAEIKKVINNRKLTKEVKNEIGKELARIIGLNWDEDNAPFSVGSELDGGALLWLRAPYFEQLRSVKRVSFDSTLVFVNTCSSGANTSLSDAIKAKAFFGWKNAMDGDFISDAGETIIDSLTDKARSARVAASLYQIHELWVVRGESSPRDASRSPESLVKLGQNGTPYDAINGQTLILLYRIRHGPGSAASDIAASMGVVQSCWNSFWSAGRAAGLAGPGCRPMEFGADLPKQEDIDDAVFEAGGLVTKPYGRWTLAD
jgi:hypothetical protein